MFSQSNPHSSRMRRSIVEQYGDIWEHEEVIIIALITK